MATGKLPFEGATQEIVLDSILNSAPMPPRQRDPGVAEGLERIIGKCMEKHREVRYQHASELRADLQVLQQRGFDAVKSTPEAQAPARTRPAKGIAVVALAAAAV